MSVSTPADEESATEDQPPGTGAPLPPGAVGAVQDLYDQKAESTVVRVLTVLAYLLSVSLAAILLSVYYVCVWKPVSHNDTEPKLEMQVGKPHDYQSDGIPSYFNSTAWCGGGGAFGERRTAAMSDRSGSQRSGGSARLDPRAHDLVLDALYERKRDNKSVRVLTVIIYVFCVSLAAIMLSLYYVFFWEPKDAQFAQRKVSHTVEQQTSTTPMPTCFMPHTGGSNTTMSELTATTLTPNLTSLTDAEEPSNQTLSLLTDFPDATADFNVTWGPDNLTSTAEPEPT